MKEMDINDFLGKFNFREEGEGLIGIERERFLMAENGVPTPKSEDFLKMVNGPQWGYELSACQIEDRTIPRKTARDIRRELVTNDELGQKIARRIGLTLRAIEVAPINMPIDVYPDPRYLEIVKDINHERLAAACRVTATHIHLGMPDIDSAIRVANFLRGYIGYLSRVGDHSHGQRLRLYKTMATDWHSPFYRDKEHLFEVAKAEGFAANPRDCWHLIRISIHGTVELRMFGVTEDIDEIMRWVSIVRLILQKRKK